MRFCSLPFDMYDNMICGVDRGEDRQNRLIFRVFRLISAVFEVLQDMDKIEIKILKMSMENQYYFIV